MLPSINYQESYSAVIFARVISDKVNEKVSNNKNHRLSTAIVFELKWFLHRLVHKSSHQSLASETKVTVETVDRQISVTLPS